MRRPDSLRLCAGSIVEADVLWLGVTVGEPLDSAVLLDYRLFREGGDMWQIFVGSKQAQARKQRSEHAGKPALMQWSKQANDEAMMMMMMMIMMVLKEGGDMWQIFLAS